MPVSLNTVNVISFCGQEAASRSDNKDGAKKVVTGGGAVAAVAAASNTRATRSGFDMFKSAGRVSKGMHTFTESAKVANQTAKEAASLWSRAKNSAVWARNSILRWGNSIQNTRFIKPLVNSPAFRGAAGFLGYGFGLVTLISGCSDIAKVASDIAERNL